MAKDVIQARPLRWGDGVGLSRWALNAMTCLPVKGRQREIWEMTQNREAFQVALAVKNPPDNAGDLRDEGLILGLGSSPGGGHGNPLQYSCLEHPMDRGAWWARVHGLAKSWTWLKWLSMHACTEKRRYEDHRGTVEGVGLDVWNDVATS